MERAELKRLVESSGCARGAGEFLFLADPEWGVLETEQFNALVAKAPEIDSSEGWLCIPTGGTSGTLRYARHDEKTIAAAVSGFSRHFGLTRIHAVGVLPIYHVSGLMARLRCALTGGRYVDWSWKRLAAGDYPQLSEGDQSTISLVPTQLHRLLGQPEGVSFLKRFSRVLLGGAPLWPGLADAAREAKVPIALTYGMTETAAMVAAQSPGDFDAGKMDSGTALPHAKLEIVDEATELSLPPGAVGRLVVSSKSVFRGYFPDLKRSTRLATEDLATLTEDGRLILKGRLDAVIMTGGKKVWPGEVEQALRELVGDIDVAVVGIPDAEWGEIVVACFAQNSPLNSNEMRDRLSARLASYKIPKRFLTLPGLLRNAQGKINRRALREAAKSAL